jgi:transposase-like protein
MGRSGRPPAGLDDYLEWQQRLQSQKDSGLSVNEFCLQEGFNKTTFYKWVKRLHEGIPQEMLAEQAARDQAEAGDALFLPVTLRTSPVEVELPNGARLRLPVGVGQAALVEVLRLVGDLPPRRAPRP